MNTAPQNERDASFLFHDTTRQFLSILFHDTTRQFLSIAFAGIGFAIGMSQLSPSPVSAWLFWLILLSFGVSGVAGLLTLMHATGLIAIDNDYNVYRGSLRLSAIVQHLTAFIGIGLLCCCIGVKRTETPNEHQSPAAHCKTCQCNCE